LKNFPLAPTLTQPIDRCPAGELFALFILGVTFIACLLLVLILSLAKA